jgi:cell division septal protein FtsQ
VNQLPPNLHKTRSQARKMPRWMIGLPILVLLAVLTGLGIASGWLHSLAVPRKIVVHGNAIIPADELVSAAAQNRDAVYWDWWRALSGLSHERVRWLASAKPRIGWGRTLVVEVAEQRPVLQASAPDGEYWLRDDFQLVPVDESQDRHPVFETIKHLPAVEFELPIREYAPSQGESLIITAACLQQVMPGVVRRIKLDRAGLLWCYTSAGFTIKLGEPERLAEKIGALPKALRLCAAQQQDLDYLDASDPRIFYQRWQEPPQA